MDNIDEEYDRLVEHLHDCAKKAESFKTTKRRLSLETLELIRQRGATRAAGNQELTLYVKKEHYSSNNCEKKAPQLSQPPRYNNAAYFATSGVLGVNSSRSSEISRTEIGDLLSEDGSDSQTVSQHNNIMTSDNS
ncbi:hypothetical protein NECAME_06766 [Necator americanus]|uniref:Uncharacterized protein n=1 Tax=Necator americanus TaxID=51031 RepID=W2TUD8_NECAM|nr:hypothetical protein NECAME_06766 [Necator americanus]ETN84667.1 hypothetical protein NECAME_06766 [Necator americanus]